MMSQKNNSKEKLKLAVLISNAGTGTNLQAIIDGIEKDKIKMEICAVVSDVSDAAGLDRARKHNLKIEICPTKEALLPLLQRLNPDFVALAGWKQIILDEVILAFPNKILNLHPGLIPDSIDGIVKNPDGTEALWNKGKLTNKAIQNFLDKKATFAGSSIHFLTLNFDFGPVLGRTFEKIQAGDTVDSLYARLKNKENELYEEVLEKLTSPQPSPERRGGINRQKILIIGSGGREHAIGWKVAQSPRAGQIFFAPGNAGTAELGTNVAIDAKDISKLLEFAKNGKINLTLALPDDPLALGIVDEFQKAGLRIWGPTKRAAQIEWSKAFSKDFMRRHNLPTAKFEIFSDFEKAKNYVKNQSLPIVIKASGLALGKGVIICETIKEANETLENILVKKIFGDAGNEVVIEEFLVGPEISIHAFSDGKDYKMFPPSQDHKKVGEGNTGPNTGGMGTISPLPFVDEKLLKTIEDTIVAPTLKALAKDNAPFVGVLYPGLILTKDGPKILEYNARFGDPETQTYMRLLETDLLDIFDACIDGTLKNLEIKWRPKSACTIVLASGGYPGKYEKGKEILGISPLLVEEGVGGGDSDPLSNLPLSKGRGSQPPRLSGSPPSKGGEDVVIFHAGTKMENKNLVTNGGRVLGVSAVGKNLQEALKKAYKAIEKISFEGMQYRKDIGKSALELK
ncbi:MAG: phosphoribosylamine--glycine ligase [Candidatus Nomurabacteria bacterium]|nr:phosphoribosylamine--glycine ligase [Candidatus Nomurabacteria bacterium]